MAHTTYVSTACAITLIMALLGACDPPRIRLSHGTTVVASSTGTGVRSCDGDHAPTLPRPNLTRQEPRPPGLLEIVPVEAVRVNAGSSSATFRVIAEHPDGVRCIGIVAPSEGGFTASTTQPAGEASAVERTPCAGHDASTSIYREPSHLSFTYDSTLPGRRAGFTFARRATVFGGWLYVEAFSFAGERLATEPIFVVDQRAVCAF